HAAREPEVRHRVSRADRLPGERGELCEDPDSEEGGQRSPRPEQPLRDAADDEERDEVEDGAADAPVLLYERGDESPQLAVPIRAASRSSASRTGETSRPTTEGIATRTSSVNVAQPGRGSRRSPVTSSRAPAAAGT